MDGRHVVGNQTAVWAASTPITQQRSFLLLFFVKYEIYTSVPEIRTAPKEVIDRLSSRLESKTMCQATPFVQGYSIC